MYLHFNTYIAISIKLAIQYFNIFELSVMSTLITTPVATLLLTDTP